MSKKVIGYENTRNGYCVDIIGLSIDTNYDDRVRIDGVGVRGAILNGGGLVVDKADFAEAAMNWLLSEGYSVGVPAENVHNFVDGEEV